MIFEGWKYWTRYDDERGEIQPPPETQKPEPTKQAPQPPKDEEQDKPFDQRAVVNQIAHILRETLVADFPDAFEAVRQALHRYQELGFFLRC